MPRRQTPDPLALRIGQRIRNLRQQAGLSLEKLAYESELGSKGHLSDLERGLTRPTITTLQAVADRLGVALLDLVSFPEDGARERLVEALRAVPDPEIDRLVARFAKEPSALPAPTSDDALRVGESRRDEADPYLRALGEGLRAERERRGKGVEEIARAAGLDAERYRAVEAGAWDLPIRRLARIAEALGTELRDLLP